MKETFCQSMAWLHTWTGLVAGWVLFFVFVTGTAGYFDDEITRWMQPERPLAMAVSHPDKGALVELALDRLEQAAAGATQWTITLPHRALEPRGWREFGIAWGTFSGEEVLQQGSERLDPETGAVLPEAPEPRATGGGNQLYAMHYALHYFPYDVSIGIVGICSMLMLLAILTGLVTHKRIFRDFFSFRPGKGQLSWLDAHTTIGVLALPFMLMITYSGLVFFYHQFMPVGMWVVFGPDQAAREEYRDDYFQRREQHYLPVSRPALDLGTAVQQAERLWGVDTVASLTLQHESTAAATVVLRKAGGSLYEEGEPTLSLDASAGTPDVPEPAHRATRETRLVMLGLHEGLFAQGALRWLYFLMGLLGCGMVGTGLVLWTVKRRERHASECGTAARAGLRLVEALNVATIAGLPVAVAAYFWANRLLPAAWATRAQWEVHVMFLVWGCVLVHACCRPVKKAWAEVLWLAATAFAVLPLLNAVTTERHLGVTLPAGDWALAGVDLTMLVLAAMFAFMRFRLRRGWAASMDVAAPAHSSRRTRVVEEGA